MFSLTDEIDCGLNAKLPIGDYVGRVTRHGFNDVPIKVTIRENETTTIDVVLPWQRVLVVKVIDQDGNSMANWPVMVGENKYTDENGIFRIFNLSPGITGMGVHSQGEVNGEIKEYINYDYKMYYGYTSSIVLPESGTVQTTVRMREVTGKKLRELCIICKLKEGQTITKAPVMDVSWEGQTAHFESEGMISELSFIVPHTADVVNMSVRFTIGINSKSYTINKTEEIDFTKNPKSSSILWKLGPVG